MLIALIWSVVVNVILLIVARNLFVQNEKIVEYNDRLIAHIEEVRIGIESTIERMREIDLSGAFESHDIVGGTFKQMLGLVSYTANFLEALNAPE